MPDVPMEVVGRLTYAGEELVIMRGRYAVNARPAIMLFTAEGAPYGRVSINVPEIDLERDQLIVHHELEVELGQLLLASGHFHATGALVGYGHQGRVQSQVWSVIR